MRATWKPHEKSGTLTKRADLPDSVFAYPHERKEPMTNASHVRNAVARFDQVDGVSDAARDLAFANIKKAAKHYDVDLTEKSWKELGKKPAPTTASTRKKSTTVKKIVTRKKSASGKATTTPKKKTRKKATSKKTARKKP
jgi:hypothetical protein